MPEAIDFVAQVDAAQGHLALAGDCRAVDLAALDTALAAWSAAGARSLDLSNAGALDIGPAWLLQRAIADAAATPAIQGTLPAHFTYLEELLDGASARTPDPPPLPGPGRPA